VAVHDAGALAEALARAARAPSDTEVLVAAAPGSWAESAGRLRVVLEEAVGTAR
jgi:hypothetical protein